MSGQHRDWDAILERVYAARRGGGPRPSLQEIVSMATGKREIPVDLGADWREFVDTVAEWEGYDWQDQAATESPFDVLVCWVHQQVRIVMSSLTWQPAAVTGVRGESGAELMGVRTVTASGAHLELVPDLNGGARLHLSFPAQTAVPARVELKRDGVLIDSVPAREDIFHFDLPEPGVYALELCYADRTVGLLALALENAVSDADAGDPDPA